MRSWEGDKKEKKMHVVIKSSVFKWEWEQGVILKRPLTSYSDSCVSISITEGVYIESIRMKNQQFCHFSSNTET